MDMKERETECERDREEEAQGLRSALIAVAAGARRAGRWPIIVLVVDDGWKREKQGREE